MFAISQGKYVSQRKYATLKHTSLGLGLRSMNGMKYFAPSWSFISYDMVCRIETAQAELSQELLKTLNMLPLKPDHEG